MKYKDFIENKYTDNFDTEDYCLDELTQTLINENIVDENILNEDRTSTVVNMLSIGLIVKLRNQTKKVKQETDTNKKLDELSVLVQMSGYGGLIGGFVGSKNTKILNKIRGVKR